MVDWLLDFEPTGSSITDQMLMRDMIAVTLGLHGETADALNPMNYTPVSLDPDNYTGAVRIMQRLLLLRAPQRTGMSLAQLINLPPADLSALIILLRHIQDNHSPYIDELNNALG